MKEYNNGTPVRKALPNKEKPIISVSGHRVCKSDSQGIIGLMDALMDQDAEYLMDLTIRKVSS